VVTDEDAEEHEAQAAARLHGYDVGLHVHGKLIVAEGGGVDTEVGDERRAGGA
jgi:hypothetical protein